MMRTSSRIGSVKELVSFVNQVNVCYLFKRGQHPRLCDMVEAEDVTVRRGLIMGWAERAHLEKKLFLLVDEKGSLLLVSWKRFAELSKDRSQVELSNDETRVLEILTGSMSTPEMRIASHLPGNRFSKALIGLRSRMRIALVEVRKESSTKYLNCYDRIERWRSSS